MLIGQTKTPIIKSLLKKRQNPYRFLRFLNIKWYRKKPILKVFRQLVPPRNDFNITKCLCLCDI